MSFTDVASRTVKMQPVEAEPGEWKKHMDQKFVNVGGSVLKAGATAIAVVGALSGAGLPLLGFMAALYGTGALMKGFARADAKWEANNQAAEKQGLPRSEGKRESTFVETAKTILRPF